MASRDENCPVPWYGDNLKGRTRGVYNSVVIAVVSNGSHPLYNSPSIETRHLLGEL